MEISKQKVKEEERIPDKEITPPSLYFNRRKWIEMATIAGSIAATAGAYRLLNPAVPSVPKTIEPITNTTVPRPGTSSDEVAATGPDSWAIPDVQTPEHITVNYNNFYEFTTEKSHVARAAEDFKTDGWKITVDGLVAKPRTFTIDELHSLRKPEERIYRMRCVETWSMVIPWLGIPLATLIDAVEPTSDAKYVAFETLFDPERMPGQHTNVLDWPYVEGLRMDEARHPLTLLATGMYGRSMPPQDGAPVRLVVTWKYGFKGIKSIVKISFVPNEPPTTWNRFAPREYGFYANVNPKVDHPRWSQATELRLGEDRRRKTLLFNGYEDLVADLYTGMDLRKYF